MRSSVLVVLAAVLLFASRVAAQVTVLTHAPVIDGTGAVPQPGVTIVMDNGRIKDMGPSSQIAAPADASVVDLAGRFIVPGIINAHGHVGANRDPQLRQYALYGVTTTTSMAFDSDDIVAFKAGQRRGDLRGARILTVKWVELSRDREQKFMYVMNGRNEVVHVLDHASGRILSSFGRPGHQLANFTHGHTLAVDSQGSS